MRHLAVFTISSALLFASFAARADLICDQLLDSSSPEAVAFRTNQWQAQRLNALAGQSTTLDFATWNLNLLKIGYGVGQYLKYDVIATEYEPRSQRIGPLLERYLTSPQAPAVFMLQEIWTKGDHAMIAKVAEESGYQIVDENEERRTHTGLQILVKKAEIQSIDGYDFEPYAYTRFGFEFLGKVQRGFLWLKVTLNDGQRLMIGTTHLTPFAKLKHARAREQQIKSLAAMVERLRPTVDHIVIGGDLNIAADFESDGREDQELVKVRKLYVRFAEAVGLRDTFRAVNAHDPGYTFNANVRPLDRLKTERISFKRLDYIFAGEQSEQFAQVVQESTLGFMHPLDCDGHEDACGIYPSDHYLLRTQIRLFAVKSSP